MAFQLLEIDNFNEFLDWFDGIAYTPECETAEFKEWCAWFGMSDLFD